MDRLRISAVLPAEAKNDFNSIYGMCVQKLIPQEYDIDAYFYWKPKELPYKKQKQRLFRNFFFDFRVTEECCDEFSGTIGFVTAGETTGNEDHLCFFYFL